MALPSGNTLFDIDLRIGKSTVTLNGSNVSAADDNGTNGNQATQDTAGSQPPYFTYGPYPSIQCGTKFLRLPISMSYSSQAATFAVVRDNYWQTGLQYAFQPADIAGDVSSLEMACGTSHPSFDEMWSYSGFKHGVLKRNLRRSVVVYRFGPTGVDFYEGNINRKVTTSAIGNFLRYGGNLVSDSEEHGIYRAVGYSETVSDSKLALLFNELYSSHGLADSYTHNLVICGDSIGRSFPGDGTVNFRAWHRYMDNLSPRVFLAANLGANGCQFANNSGNDLASKRATIAGYLSTSYYGSKLTDVLQIRCGRNDYAGGKSISTIMNDAASVIANAKSDGFDKVAISTMTPETGDYESDHSATGVYGFNTTLRSQYRNIGADILIDPWAYSDHSLTQAGATTGAYYHDGLHLSADGATPGYVLYGEINGYYLNQGLFTPTPETVAAIAPPAHDDGIDQSNAMCLALV